MNFKSALINYQFIRNTKYDKIPGKSYPIFNKMPAEILNTVLKKSKD